MNVGFAYNVKVNDPSLDPTKQKDIEFDSPDVIAGIEKTLIALGHKVIKIEADENAFENLKKNKDKIDIVFNIAEGFSGDARESQIPIFCEILGIAYTHSNPTAHAIGLDKTFSKLVAKGAGILTPGFQIIRNISDQIDNNLKFPLIVKPNSEGSSKGVYDKNIVYDKESLVARIKFISKGFSDGVLIEEFIKGREFTVAVLGNDDPKILPIIEQKFDFLPKGYHKIAGYELKWFYEDKLKDLHDAYDCPAKLSNKLQNKIEETSKKIFKVLNVKDCARIDFRLDAKENLYFLEVNTLPGINPDENLISYFPLASRMAGMRYKDLIAEILNLAAKRYGL